MSLNPPLDYQRQHSGEAFGQFETEARVWTLPPLLLARAHYEPDSPLPVPTLVDVVLDVTKPDPRLSAEIQVGFVCDGFFSNIDLADLAQNGTALGANIAASKIWLSLLGDEGGGLREIEDIIGTRAAPDPLIAAGLWGATFEVDVDCIAVRLALRLAQPWVDGRYVAAVRWTANETMSQRDWEHARQNMNRTAVPRVGDLLFHVDGG